MTSLLHPAHRLVTLSPLATALPLPFSPPGYVQAERARAWCGQAVTDSTEAEAGPVFGPQAGAGAGIASHLQAQARSDSESARGSASGRGSGSGGIQGAVTAASDEAWGTFQQTSIAELQQEYLRLEGGFSSTCSGAAASLKRNQLSGETTA